MLPCQHSYCYGYLDQLRQDQNFKCPYCQKPIDSTLENLPQPRYGPIYLAGSTSSVVITGVFRESLQNGPNKD